MALSALVFAFKALLKIRRRLLDNYNSSEHLQQNLQDFVASLAGARPRDQVRGQTSSALQATLQTAQDKLNAFANAGWISRLGDWEATFEQQKDNVFWALITHVAADVIDLDEEQQRALQRRARPTPPDIAERPATPRPEGWILPAEGQWGVITSSLTHSDPAEAHAFVRAAVVIVQRALTREPSGWTCEIDLSTLPVPDFERGDAVCAEGFVRALLVPEGLDQATCRELAYAIEQIKCVELVKKMAKLLTEHLGQLGKPAACQILNQLLNPEYCHKDVFTNQLIASLNESVLGVLGKMLEGDVKMDSLAILGRLTKVERGRRRILILLGDHEALFVQVLGTFCDMKQDDPGSSQAAEIVRRLGSLRGSSCFRAKDVDVQHARAQIKLMLGGMSGQPMTVTLWHKFTYG